MTLQALFDEHAGIALSRQRDLAAQIGDWRWDYDGPAGTMAFSKPGLFGFGGKRITSKAQLLGSESEIAGTWLWSWANRQVEVAAVALRAANELRARGERDGIEELSSRSFPLDRWDGHQIAMLASGLFDASGYYRGPYDGGAIFVLLEEPSLRVTDDQPVLRFSTVMQELIGGFEVHDHRLAARGLARGLGLSAAGEPGAPLRVSGPAGALELTFDSLGRMTKLEGSLGPR